MSSTSLIGVWYLVSFVARNESGTEVLPLGECPMGQIIYTAPGHMAAVLSQRDRPAFASPDRRQATQEELRALFEGFEAYSGTFTVHQEAGKVIHHVTQSLWPNAFGTDYVRFFEFDAAEVVLATPPVLAWGERWVSRLRWRRTEDDA